MVLVASPLVYPNPATDVVYLEFAEGASGTAEIILTGMDGIVVLESSFEGGGTHMLDLSSVPEGLYFLAIVTDSGTSTSRLEIKK